MSDFQTPPTFANPIVIDAAGNPQFNPIWLRWFLDIAAFISSSGGAGGSALHNILTDLQGGTANQYYHLTQTQNQLIQTISSGTYTPTLFNTTNMAASTAYTCQWVRTGTMVSVSGKVDVDPTAGGISTVLGISLPIASLLSAPEQLAGVAFAPGIAGQGAAMVGDHINDRAQMQWISGDITNQPMFFTFSYTVL